MFFKHFASKNQLPGLFVNGTLVGNGLIYKIYLFCVLHILEKWGSNLGITLTTLWALAATELRFFNIFLHWNTPNQDPNKSVPTFFLLFKYLFNICFRLFSFKMHFQNSKLPNFQSIAIKRITCFYKNIGHSFVQQSVRNECKEFEVDRFSSFRTGVRHAHTKCSSGNYCNHENCKTLKHIFWSICHLSNFFWNLYFFSQ